MNRRKFIHKSFKYSLAVGLPYLLPSGRLFASTGNQKAKHVVLCLFAGGIRNKESLLQEDGSLMRNFLGDNVPFKSDIAGSIEQMPIILNNPLQNYGTLYSKFQYKSNFVLHYNAHAACITGNYCNSVELMKPIKFPTIFEYFRKHSHWGADALSTWWVTDQLGPFPYLKYSNHPLYGPLYGANMIQPTSYFQFPQLSNDVIYNNHHVNHLMNLIQSNSNIKQTEPYFSNSEDGKARITHFLKSHYNSYMTPEPSFWNLNSEINGDIITMHTATEILKSFKPNLLVVNMQNSDIGHSNYTGYCKNMHKADFALAKLWQTIQEDIELRDNTVLIAVPEFGRNKNHNTVKDENGRYAVDHTGDAMSQEMFCFIGGPKHIVNQNVQIEEVKGETLDIVPTIAHLLGFLDDIPKDLVTGKVLHEAFV